MCLYKVANADHLHILIFSAWLFKGLGAREIVFLDITYLVSVNL
jgi:hypothetical protein